MYWTDESGDRWRNKQWTSESCDDQSVSESSKQWSNETTNQRMSEVREDGPMNQWISDATKRWIDHSTNQWINESMKQWVDEPTNQQIHKQVNQWANKSLNIIEPINHRINGTIKQWISAFMNQRINQAINEPVSPWTNESTSQWNNEQMNQRIKETMSGWTNKSLNPWRNEWRHEWKERMGGRMEIDEWAMCICWATSSLSDPFAEAPLLSAIYTSALSSSWSVLFLPLLWAASGWLFCSSCKQTLLFAQLVHGV